MKKFKKIIPIFLLSFFTTSAYADALSKVTGFFSKMENILRTASVSIVTVAIMIIAYQMFFNGKTFRDCFGIVIAALILGGAAEFARFLL